MFDYFPACVIGQMHLALQLPRGECAAVAFLAVRNDSLQRLYDLDPSLRYWSRTEAGYSKMFLFRKFYLFWFTTVNYFFAHQWRQTKAVLILINVSACTVCFLR